MKLEEMEQKQAMSLGALHPMQGKSGSGILEERITQIEENINMLI